MEDCPAVGEKYPRERHYVDEGGGYAETDGSPGLK